MNKKGNKDQQAQGDVLLQYISKLPEGCKEVPRIDGRIVVMHGEGGHTHVITDVDAMFHEKDGKFYLEVTAPVALVHEEHHTQIVEPGIWEIGQVREYDYFQEMERTVRD